MRKLCVLALLCLSANAYATISVSGNLKGTSTSSVTSGTSVRLWMRGCGGNQPFVAGTGLIAPDSGSTWYADFVPDGTGAISGTLYSTSEVTCGSSTGVIWYGLQIFRNGRPGPESAVSASQNINVNSPTLLSSNPVADIGTSVLQGYVFTQATGATTWTINHNLNAAVSVEFFDAAGALFWPNTVVQTSSNVLTATFTTPQTGTAVLHKAGVIALATGTQAILSNPGTNQTINGAFSLTLDTVSAKKLNSLRFADQFTGASVTAQIDNCLADFTTGVCVIPSTMGAGNPTTPIASGKMLIDFRGAGTLGMWFAGDNSANVLSRFTSSPGTVGFLDLNNGLHIHSSLDVSAGSISMRQPGSYLALHNGNFNLAETTGKYGFVQAGDTTSGNPAWNANNVFTLPDLAQGGGVDQSGYLLGAATAQLTSGNCLFASAGSGAGAGAMNDSGIGCNTHIAFPTPNNRFVRWTNGGNTLSLTGAAASADRTITLPDLAGTVKVIPTTNGSATLRLTGDTTLAANTSLQTIFSWSMPATALNYNFHCSLDYSQATAAVSDAFGIQAATNSPTNIRASGIVYTAAGTATSGTLSTLSTTTATNILTFTPSAIATVFTALIDGQLELPASTNTINIMASQSNASDLVTIKRGSYCELYQQ